MSPSKSAAAVSATSDITPAGFFGGRLSDTDPELAAAIRAELRRQQDQIELIASENIVSAAVLEAQGSVLTNKYAEGYPGPALLRRLRVCRRRRDARHRARQAAVRLQLRQCAAAFGRAGQPGAVFWRCCSRATPSWACRSRRAAI